MSVRIYQLSKEIGMDNSELLELLRERGFQVKSASSTVDNISAESLKEEFAKKSAETAKKGNLRASGRETGCGAFGYCLRSNQRANRRGKRIRERTGCDKSRASASSALSFRSNGTAIARPGPSSCGF